jgi:hypothetical protein
MAAQKSTFRLVAQRQRPFVQDAQEKIPQGGGCLFDFIAEHETELDLLCAMLIQRFLGQQRVRFAAPQISGRRPDQFRDFMAVLKFRAIDFGYCTMVLQ